MEILFLISQLPYPLDTGAKIRSFNLIKRASLTHDITLVAYGGDDSDNSKIKVLREFCKDVRVIYRKDFGIINVLLTIFSKFPYNVNKYYSKKLSALIKDLVFKKDFQLIHCDSLQMSLNLKDINDIPKIITEHNIESDIFKRYAQNQKNLLKKLFVYLQWKKLVNYEFNICKKFDQCIAVSEKDKTVLEKKMGTRNISVVANGVDTEYFHQKTGNCNFQEELSLVFTGSMDWLPNSDAVEYFCYEILPLIWKKLPQLKFYVVGRNPTSEIKTFSKKDERIIVTGRVDDVRQYVYKSNVFVVPLRIGGGTRLKILEAMSMGIPVVSTTIGAEGLNVADNKNIFLADGPDIFVEKTLQFLNNRVLKDKITKEGRLLVENEYSWDKIAKNLEQVWEKAVVK